MSYKNFEKAMILATKCKYYRTVSGVTNDEIRKSEELLGIKFSKQLIEFYEKYGYLSFYGTEIFGVFPNDLAELEGNSVSYALNDRTQYNLPYNWVPIYNFNDGYMAYLDYSHLNRENEPQVIVAFYNGNEYCIENIIAEDFGDFILSLVQMQIDQQ